MESSGSESPRGGGPAVRLRPVAAPPVRGRLAAPVRPRRELKDLAGQRAPADLALPVAELRGARPAAPIRSGPWRARASRRRARRALLWALAVLVAGVGVLA